VTLKEAFTFIKAKKGLASDIGIPYVGTSGSCPRVKRTQGNIKAFKLITAGFINPTHEQNNSALITAI